MFVFEGKVGRGGILVKGNDRSATLGRLAYHRGTTVALHWADCDIVSLFYVRAVLGASVIINVGNVSPVVLTDNMPPICCYKEYPFTVQSNLECRSMHIRSPWPML